MAVINFKYVDKKYLSTVVKNEDNGRQYLQVTCPGCNQSYSKREFYEHVCKVHGKRRDEILAKLFGIKEFPVICPDCGREVHFDEYSGIYSRKCKKCLQKDNSMANINESQSLEALLEQEKNLNEVFQAKKLELQQKIHSKLKENEWKAVNIWEDMPDVIAPQVAKYLRKVSGELRVYITNGTPDKQKAYDILNFLDKKLEDSWDIEEVQDDKSNQ